MNINANELSKQKIKDTILDEYVNGELKRIEKKIMLAHQMRQQLCYYEIRRPLNLNFSLVIKKVLRELKNKKFKITMFDDGLCYISW
jgi:hypothetical protein